MDQNRIRTNVYSRIGMVLRAQSHASAIGNTEGGIVLHAHIHPVAVSFVHSSRIDGIRMDFLMSIVSPLTN